MTYSISVAVRTLLVAAMLVCGALAQDDEPKAKPGEEKSPAEEFAAAQADFDKLRKDIQGVVQEYQTAKEEDRDAILKKYFDLVGQAVKHLERLRTAAVAAYTEAPNKDPKVVAALVSLMDNDVKRDDYDAVLKVAKLLIDNKAEHSALYTFAGRAAYGADQFAQADKWLRLAAESGVLSRQAEAELQDAAAGQERFEREQKIREAEAKADDLPRVKIETNRGVIVVELFENEAPDTVGNFVSLVEKGYYNGLAFHRVLGNFMAQGGDPKGDGTGGPDYKIYCETAKPEHREHFRGTLSMAHAGKDTGGSQFFITFRPTPHLDGKHTAFGRVIEGLDVLPKLQRREPQGEGQPPADKIVKAEVLRKREHEYKPRKVEKE